MKEGTKRKRGQKKFISIKTKLLGIILPVVIVMITILIYSSYYVTKNVIQSNVQAHQDYQNGATTFLDIFYLLEFILVVYSLYRLYKVYILLQF